MVEGKTITIQKPGGAATMQFELLPGDSVPLVCRIAAENLGFPPDGRYFLLNQDGYPLKADADAYEAVKSGDTLTLECIQGGGVA